MGRNFVLVTRLLLFIGCQQLTVHGSDTGANAGASYFSRALELVGLGSGGLDGSDIYGHVNQLETCLVNQYDKMAGEVNMSNLEEKLYRFSDAAELPGADKVVEEVNMDKPYRFSEAAELPGAMLAHIVVELDSWVKNLSNRPTSFSVPAPHILVYRNDDWKTTVIMYRPSLRPQIEEFVKKASKRKATTKGRGASLSQPSGSAPPLDPQLSYYEEAISSVKQVINVAINPNPKDQFIFVGFGGGAAVAILQAWLILGKVRELTANLVRFKGELHQVKLLLFNAECIVTESRLKQYPIPACDVLRFNSEDFRLSSSVRSKIVDPLSFEFRNRMGFAEYAAEGVKLSVNWVVGTIGAGAKGSSKRPLDSKSLFRAYYHTTQKSLRQQMFLKDDTFSRCGSRAGTITDDETQTLASNYSIKENGATSILQRLQSFMSTFVNGSTERQYSDSSSFGPCDALPLAHIPSDMMNDVDEYGSDLLNNYGEQVHYFRANADKLLHNNKDNVLQRNVRSCASRLQEHLSELLQTSSNVRAVAKGLKNQGEKTKIVSVKCKVTHFDLETRIGTVECTLQSNDRSSEGCLIFETRVDNADLTFDTIDPYVMDVSDKEAPGAENIFTQNYADAGENRDDDEVSNLSEDSEFEVVDQADRPDESELWDTCFQDLIKDWSLSLLKPAVPPKWDTQTTASLPWPWLRSDVAWNEPGLCSLPVVLPQCQRADAKCQYYLRTSSSDYATLAKACPRVFYGLIDGLVPKEPGPIVDYSYRNVLKAPEMLPEQGVEAQKASQNVIAFLKALRSEEGEAGGTKFGPFQVTHMSSSLRDLSPQSFLTKDFAKRLIESIEVPKHSYTDCTTPLSLWAGTRQCPELCRRLAIEAATTKLTSNSNVSPYVHLCSRVLTCGRQDDWFLAFRRSSNMALTEEMHREPINKLRLLRPDAFKDTADKLNSATNFIAFNIRKANAIGLVFSFDLVLFFGEQLPGELVATASDANKKSLKKNRPNIESKFCIEDDDGSVDASDEPLTGNRPNNVFNFNIENNDGSVSAFYGVRESTSPGAGAQYENTIDYSEDANEVASLNDDRGVEETAGNWMCESTIIEPVPEPAVIGAVVNVLESIQPQDTQNEPHAQNIDQDPNDSSDEHSVTANTVTTDKKKKKKKKKKGTLND